MIRLEDRFIGASVNPKYEFRNHNPLSPKILFVGSNFLFSKRLNEILKRSFSMIDVPCSPFINADGFTSFEIEKEEVVSGLIKYREINAVVITSELMFYAENLESIEKISQLIKRIKKNSKVKLILVLIEDPLLVRQSKNDAEDVIFGVNSLYQQGLKNLRNLVNPETDLVFEFSSFYGHVESEWEINTVAWVCKNGITSLSADNLSKKITPNFTDDLVKNIEDNIAKTGTYKIDGEFNEVSMSAFIDCALNRPKGMGLVVDCQPQNYNDHYFATTKEFRDSPIDNLRRGLYIQAHQEQCSLSIVYRKKPSDFLCKTTSLTSVADIRLKLGSLLAVSVPEAIKNQLDCIVPIPESGKYYAQGLAASLNIPYLEVFFKMESSARSFDIKSSDLRKEFIWSKLGLIPDIVKGKTVGIVDEAIFTGTTLKIACEMLRSSEVKGVFILIPTPESKLQCNYNMQPKRTMLLEYFRSSSLDTYFGVNGVLFQPHETFSACMIDANHHCTKCFTG